MLLWADPALLVVNKPAGLPTLPDGYQLEASCLVNLLSAEFPTVMVVHRLDKETSGILVLARTPHAHQQLSLQFERRQAAKRYRALMSGESDWAHWEVCAPLRKDGDRRRRTVVDTRRGKTSHTELNVLERYRGFALVEAIPHTGRTH
ncbi:MAG: RNA pseudouridine synthase [Anaerolineales bacterium]|nr:RNA pseudouridine synthase [Anaerolineales bacterium]